MVQTVLFITGTKTMKKIYLTQKECHQAASDVANAILGMQRFNQPMKPNNLVSLYGIPRGGVPAAYLVAAFSPRFTIAQHPENADVFIDDIIDSGRTADSYTERFPGRPFMALRTALPEAWTVFPWENDEEKADTIEDNVTRILQFVGENPKRGGLIETPKRVAKAWGHWCGGYDIDVPGLFKAFEDGAEGCDQMVVVKDIPFYSQCEHHLAPFFGTATIAYIPDKKVLGLSKFARVLDAYARRLQVQERLTNQIADAVAEHLKPKGVGVSVRARHLCMESRGVSKQGHETLTCALRGVLLTEQSARAEFLAHTRG